MILVNFKMLNVILLILITIQLANTQTNNRYHNPVKNIFDESTIREPLVEILQPKGIRVSIPHAPGMELFSFHGKLRSSNRYSDYINLSKDILHPINGRWIFQNDDVQLKNNDILDYWIFVLVNDIGHRIDNLTFVFKESKTTIRTTRASSNKISRPSLLEDRITRISQITTTKTTTTKPIFCECTPEMYRTVNSQLNITLWQLNSVLDKVTPLENQVDSLTELVKDLMKGMNIGTKLLLTGRQPPASNPLETIRTLITEKLELHDLQYKIQQAHFTKNGILFDMSSSIDKKRIQFRADKRLTNTNFKIIDPQDLESTTAITLKNPSMFNNFFYNKD